MESRLEKNLREASVNSAVKIQSLVKPENN